MSAHKEQPMTCADCRAHMQDYLDETLPRVEATRFFLHVRACEGCADELEEFKALYGMLGSLPAVEAPADFDAAVLQSIPYEAYRAMEPIRRERVPVLLEPESLPAPLRAGATRIAGLAVAAVALGLTAAGRL
ncbi:zf-HC2 domain-containing protein, partial [bacterium]|nr:zf-HC2 domain-containing protein [bacterium]